MAAPQKVPVDWDMLSRHPTIGTINTYSVVTFFVVLGLFFDVVQNLIILMGSWCQWSQLWGYWGYIIGFGIAWIAMTILQFGWEAITNALGRTTLSLSARHKNILALFYLSYTVWFAVGVVTLGGVWMYNWGHDTANAGKHCVSSGSTERAESLFFNHSIIRLTMAIVAIVQGLTALTAHTMTEMAVLKTTS